jgi:putative aldouronate transport system permease protein
MKIRNIIRGNGEYFLMLAPAFILILIFSYIPMFGIIIAFKNINYESGIFMSPWAGLKNFEFLFKNPDVFIVVRNTLLYNIAFIILDIMVPVFFAIMLSLITNKYRAKFYQSLMFLPYFLSWIIVSYVGLALFDYNLGMVNNSILKPLGLESIRWYSTPQYWPYIIIITHMWKSIGYNTVIYLAAITSINKEMYEAAVIDGANKFKQTMHITIPSLAPIMIIILIMSTGKIFNANFGLFFNLPLNSSSLLSVTNVIDTFVYTALRINNDVGMSSAAGFLQSVIGFILVMSTNYIVSKIDSSKSLF